MTDPQHSSKSVNRVDVESGLTRAFPPYSLDFDHRAVAKELNELHKARGDFICDLHAPEKKFYALGMFPYPSGNAHMGHVLVYSIADVRARMAKLEGHNVLNPIGWDAFGLPAENAAIKHQVDPAVWTKLNISKMSNEQFVDMGWSFDTTKELSTCDPVYYANTQRLFLLMYSRGQAYRGDGLVNWDPVDQTVLANEQVNCDGTSWRSGALVEKRWMKQWYFKTSDYAERLWNDLSKLGNWPHSAIAVQRNWIRKMEGAMVDFVAPDDSARVSVFTTRLDTLLGVSAVVIAPEHPIAREVATKSDRVDISNYIGIALRKSNVERAAGQEISGVKTNIKLKHPLTDELLPVFISDYVLGDTANAAVMCVPAHNERDERFAKAFGIKSTPVIEGSETPYLDGILIDSREFTGLSSQVARKAIASRLKEMGLGGESVVFNLRDWSVGRQRYWGCPIPIVYCNDCGTVPVPEDQLPVLLPSKNGTSVNKKHSLADDSNFVNTECPCCKGPAKRETDTLDTFVCSSWYAFRFLDPLNRAELFDSKLADKWMPIDFYVGGLEHAAQHMIYFRYITKVLHDSGLSPSDEPVDSFYCNGMIRKDGAKMSKSRANVIVPTEIIEKYGGDAVRLCVLSDTPADQDREWSDNGLEAKSRFINRCYISLNRLLDRTSAFGANDNGDIAQLDGQFVANFYRLTATLRESIKSGQYHVGIARIYQLSHLLFDSFDKNQFMTVPIASAIRKVVKDFLIVCSPYMPYMTEAVFCQHFGKETGIFNQRWPDLSPQIIPSNITEIVVQVNGKKRAITSAPKDASYDEIKEFLLRDPMIERALNNQSVLNVIYKPGKFINFIVRPTGSV